MRWKAGKVQGAERQDVALNHIGAELLFRLCEPDCIRRQVQPAQRRRSLLSGGEQCVQIGGLFRRQIG